MGAEELRQATAAEWARTRETILADVHEVDRLATRIWWHFFPLALSDAFDTGEDAVLVTRRLRIDGNPRLADGQIETSHEFLYGHRYWPAVKAAVIAWAGGGSVDRTSPVADRSDLPAIVRQLARQAAEASATDVGLTLGITLVGLMTLRQVGVERFVAAPPPSMAISAGPAGPSPDAIVARRGRDDRQGPLGFLRSVKRYSVVFDEPSTDGAFSILENQHLTTAAAADGRDRTAGPRRFHEGPIPAQCRSATCGTCWIGVLGGRDKLNEIEPHEKTRLRAFGYLNVDDPRPIIRLACQARAFGNTTIVIPPWNGVIARLYADVAGTPGGDPA